MARQTLAEKSLLSIDRNNPRFQGQFNVQSAQRAYRLSGGKGDIDRASDSLLDAATKRMHARMEGGRVDPKTIPILSLNTGSPSAITVYQHLDRSFAIGVDQGLIAWQAIAIASIIRDEAMGRTDKKTISRLLSLCDIMIFQRYPKHVKIGFLNILRTWTGMMCLKKKWKQLGVLLSCASCDFMIAHEFAHIELGHLDLSSDQDSRNSEPMDREFAADLWSFDRCLSTEYARDLDEVDFGFIHHYGIREQALRSVRVEFMKHGVSMFLSLWSLIEDVFPQNSRTHPASLDRIENLSVSFDPSQTQVGPIDFDLFMRVYSRVRRIRKSEAWRKALTQSM